MKRIFRTGKGKSDSPPAKAMRRLFSSGTVLFSLTVTGITLLTAILGYLITPDSTPFANEQHLEIAGQKPGFSVTMLRLPKESDPGFCSIIRRWLYGCPSSDINLPVGSYILAGDSITVTVYERASDSEVLTYRHNIREILKIPENEARAETDISGIHNEFIRKHLIKKRYLLGTDRFGRDMLSQLMIGARVSLSVGFISVMISLFLGIFLGALAGFFGGRTDDFIVWLINVIWSIPTLLLVIAITFALGKGFWQVFIAVGLTMWVEVARVVRGQILSLREKEFAEAARALGFRSSRIILNHILPNTMGPVIVISAANFASAILTEAGLSFLGIGVQPPMPSWGTLIKENYPYIILDNPWLAILPGTCILLLVLSFMLIGNGLRDALDVRSTSR